jgi:hypothetical protein
MLLLVVGFLIGPLKLLGNFWVSYLSPDALAVLIITVVFGERIASRKPLLAATPLSIPLLLLAGFCVLQLGNPEAPFIRSMLGLRSWVLYLGFYFVGFYTLRNVRQLEQIYCLILGLGVLTALYGVYQWQAGPESFATWSDYYGQWARLTWSARSGSVFRAFSTFVNPGTFALNMTLIMLLAFSVATGQSIRTRWRTLASAAFVVMGVAIAVSGSRGPAAYLLIAGAMALLLIPGLSSRLRIVANGAMMVGVALVLVVVLVGPVISERFATILDPQTVFWKWFGPLTNGITIAREHPFGMGLGYTAGIPRFTSNPTIRDLATTNLDSGYGSAAAELGFLGLFVFGFFALKVGIEGFRTWRELSPGRLRDLLLGPALMAITYPMVSVIFQPQAALPNAIYFWLLVGMLMKAPLLQRDLNADPLFPSTVHPEQ